MVESKFGNREPLGEKIETGISGDIKWITLYFMEFERLRTSKTQEEYTHRVRQIEMMLKPYWDDKYKQDLKKAEKEYDEEVNKIAINGTVTEAEKRTLDMELLYKKTGLFEELVYRRKMSPQPTIPQKTISANEDHGGK